MRAQPISERRSLLAALAARAEAWLLEPAPGATAPHEPAPRGPEPRIVAGVIGLSPRCGASTVARGLGALLASRDPSGAAIVCTPRVPPGPLVRVPAAARLARALGEVGIEASRPAGRLCLVPAVDAHPAVSSGRSLAPVVLDVPLGTSVAEAARLADVIVLVSSPSTEPALTEVVREAVTRLGREAVLAVSRVRPGEEPLSRGAYALPESRVAAQLALAGREPPGTFGAALSELATACRAGVS